MTDCKKLASDNLGLVHACAAKFRNRGVEYDDLFGAGCVGLMKAANGFDESLGFAFSTYAVPVILGEIKRIFRDGGTVKVSRILKEKARNAVFEKEKLSEKLGREPTISEVAAVLSLDVSETAELLLAAMPPLSLTAADDENENKELLVPVLGEEERISEQLDLKKCLCDLNENDRMLIELRFFKGQTQSDAAKRLGMSQVQVSRREKVILSEMRKKMAG